MPLLVLKAAMRLIARQFLLLRRVFRLPIRNKHIFLKMLTSSLNSVYAKLYKFRMLYRTVLLNSHKHLQQRDRARPIQNHFFVVFI